MKKPRLGFILPASGIVSGLDFVGLCRVRTRGWRYQDTRPDRCIICLACIIAVPGISGRIWEL